jgi:enoyl-CoA hydratase/carnithine racemase
VNATIAVEQRGGVLTVILNRPERRNAVGLAMQRELSALWGSVRDDSDGDGTVVRCIVVTGAGDAFCGGADVADLAEMTGPSASGRIEFCPAATVAVPVIVAVNGLCVGAGLRFVADADIVLAAESAWFSDPHVSLGQLGLPVALALAEKASASAVAQLFLSGRAHRLSATAALAAGIVSEVVPDDELARRAAEIAAEVAAQSPAAVRRTVAGLRRRHRLALGGQVDEAWSAVAAQRRHPEAVEGIAAASERRAPSWSGDGTLL